MLRMLLRSEVAEKIGRIYASGIAPTAQQLADFKAARTARPKFSERVEGARPAAATDPENYAVVGSVAQINVEGVLSEEPDFFAWLFGLDGTTYEDIRDAFALAAADPLVKSVVLRVASPGGYMEGLFETLAAIEAFSKPITVQATQACSAAYAIAAMAGQITALGAAAEFGSVGVACSYSFYADEERVDVTSTEAPNKRPDPRTPDGKAVIVGYLDALHELFVDAIARGRTSATGTKYSADQVNAEFGRGAIVLADAAKKYGMIDKLPRAVKRGANAQAEDHGADPKPTQESKASEPAPTSSSQNNPRDAGPKKVKPMTKEELKAQHPELYAAIAAEGRAEGQAAERKRVNALLKIGNSTGAMKVAHDAIASGASCMDEEVHAEFMSAQLNARDKNNRQGDSDDAGKALGTTPATGGGEGGSALDLGDKVADIIEAQMGRKKVA